MSTTTEPIAVSILSEIFAVDQLARGRIGRVLPKGMELNQFSVLNHLAHIQAERTPAQLARSFSVTRGAMTNTLSKLERAGQVHIRPDWDDARRKFVAISAAGLQAQEAGLAAVAPILAELTNAIGEEEMKASLPVLREMRRMLGNPDAG